MQSTIRRTRRQRRWVRGTRRGQPSTEQQAAGRFTVVQPEVAEGFEFQHWIDSISREQSALATLVGFQPSLTYNTAEITRVDRRSDHR